MQDLGTSLNAWISVLVLRVGSMGAVFACAPKPRHQRQVIGAIVLHAKIFWQEERTTVSEKGPVMKFLCLRGPLLLSLPSAFPCNQLMDFFHKPACSVITS